MSVCLVVCVLPCNGLATCPGCTPPPAHRLLEIGTSSPATHYGISGLERCHCKVGSWSGSCQQLLDRGKACQGYPQRILCGRGSRTMATHSMTEQFF
ncbi:hypothetical protein AMECASPLE_039864 [Ameca splendens]|uniref:Secreted protein n=1 Tax=Ameca splendens TaxID=208324 RepID=A0ABV1A3Y3_9TELE